jgi:hypothetical protein
MHQDTEHQAHGVDEQVALAPRERLGPVVAVRAAALRRLDRRASHNRRAGGGPAPDPPPQALTERGVYPLPRPVHGLGAQVSIDGGPWAVLSWQQPPLARWQPLRSPWKMPLTHRRRSTVRGRPPSFGGGSKGTRRAHSHSLRSEG